MIDEHTLLVSSGWWNKSKLVLLNFNLDTCEFEETFTENLPSKYFAEGSTLTDQNQIF